MTGDYARWLENEVALVLTFDRPEPGEEADPVAELARQRASELLAESADENWLGI